MALNGLDINTLDDVEAACLFMYCIKDCNNVRREKK
jgi:hypothetical protein